MSTQKPFKLGKPTMMLAGIAGAILFSLLMIQSARATEAGRITVSLNGVWQIEESVAANEIPAAFNHKVVVPGLVNLAEPAFPGVDLFASREYLQRFGRKYPWGSTNQILAADAPGSQFPGIGLPAQKQNYFWYRTTFTPALKREVALLRIGKSQFGTAVFLNGKPVGEHLGCWTSSVYNLTDAINWSGENVLLVRIGAHPAVLPENIIGAGRYSSKHKWTPGIYDDVRLTLCDNPVIESVQVAPRIATSEVMVQTKLKNYGPARNFELAHDVRARESRWPARTRFEPLRGRLEAGEERTFTQTNRLAKAHLWSPEDPFLYVVDSHSGGDSVQTRFGMREYRFDSKTRMGYLNGRPYYLRGGNLELHLHFEDPLCGATPWDRAWVKKMLVDIPKKMNWKSFRFSMSPVPDFWLDMADEQGILVQLEPMVWNAYAKWDAGLVIKEYGRWMRDNWNHPCVFMWDSSNETDWYKLPEIVKAVRPLDLSNRAWENSWSPPAGPDDPCEAHPYPFPRFSDLRQLNTFKPDDTWKGWYRSADAAGHPCIINEYCGLWLYPDGRPITDDQGGWVSTKRFYDPAVPNGTAQERQEYRWYLTAALTEMWRAQRCAVGVLYYEYLGSYLPREAGPFHIGVFSDVRTLQLQPEFVDYMTEAFKPLGVYIRFWGDEGVRQALAYGQWRPIRGGAEHSFPVELINDEPEPVFGKLVLSLEDLAGRVLASRDKPFRMEAFGKTAVDLSLPIPQAKGKYLLKAVAYPDGTHHKGPTVCRRKIVVEDLQTKPQ